MENKKNSMLIAFVFSSISGFIIFLLYAIPIFAFNAILQVENIRDFIFSMYDSIKFGIWFIIALSLLLGFFSVIMLLISDRSYKFKKRITDFLLFFIISFAIMSSFFYYGTFHIILMQENGTILYILFIITNFVLSIYLICMLRYLFFYFYKIILEAFSFDSTLFIVSDEAPSLNADEQFIMKEMAFNSSLYSTMAFALRNKCAIGVIAYRITNREKIIEKYGMHEYLLFERDVINTIEYRSRSGENQLFSKDGCLYSLLFATEEGACQAAEIFFDLLENIDIYHQLESADHELVKLNFSVSVAGFDFSKTQTTASINILIEKLEQKIVEALNESEILEHPVVYYE